jgi:hypothetical protein
MKYKDRPDLPVPLVNALVDSNREYYEEKKLHLNDAPEHDIELSVTTLNKPPRQMQLFKRHHNNIVVDPLDDWYALQGRIIHYILQEYAKEERFVVERRIGRVFNIDGVRVYIHGQLDLYDSESCELTDWKYTSATSVMYDQPDYEFQLNVLYYLARTELKWRIDSLQNVYLFRHLDKRLMSKEGYPQENAMHLPRRKLGKTEIEDKIEERIRVHLNARNLDDKDLPECTLDEKWQRGNLYKIYELLKSGERFKKTASFSGAYDAAQAYIKEKKFQGNQFQLRKIESMPLKCVDYCKVKGYCNQYKTWLESHVDTEEDQD